MTMLTSRPGMTMTFFGVLAVEGGHHLGVGQCRRLDLGGGRRRPRR